MDERQRELRRLHQETWIKVKKAVDDADPEGLLAMGAPTDEYDDAVAELTRRLLKGEAVDERGIAAWFAATYGLAPSRVGALVTKLAAIKLPNQVTTRHRTAKR